MSALARSSPLALPMATGPASRSGARVLQVDSKPDHIGSGFPRNRGKLKLIQAEAQAWAEA